MLKLLQSDVLCFMNKNPYPIASLLKSRNVVGEDIILGLELATGVSKQEQESISGVLETVGAHLSTLESFREEHSGHATSIEEKAQETFLNQYMVSQCGSQI